MASVGAQARPLPNPRDALRRNQLESDSLALRQRDAASPEDERPISAGARPTRTGSTLGARTASAANALPNMSAVGRNSSGQGEQDQQRKSQLDSGGAAAKLGKGPGGAVPGGGAPGGVDPQNAAKGAQALLSGDTAGAKKAAFKALDDLAWKTVWEDITTISLNYLLLRGWFGAYKEWETWKQIAYFAFLILLVILVPMVITMLTVTACTMVAPCAAYVAYEGAKQAIGDLWSWFGG